MPTATITTAIALSADQREKLQEVLKKKYQVSDIEEKIDQAILGGMKVTIGSRQIDLSVKNTLNTLKSN